MIIYTVTVTLDSKIVSKWIEWMCNTHIKDVLLTGKFLNARLAKVETTNNTENTYSIQYSCKDKIVLNEYLQKYAPKLQQEHIEKFGSKALSFRTILTDVKDFTP